MRRVLPVLLAVLASSVVAVGAGQPTVLVDGRPYVELERVAAGLETRLDATPGSIRAYLRTPGHVVVLTRNWARIVVDGTPLVLEAPVIVRRGVWLAPQTFVASVIPRVTGGPVAPAGAPAGMPAPTVRAGAAAAPPPAPPGIVAQAPSSSEVTLEEIRHRSYPSFSRVVIETSAPAPYRVERRGGREAVIRLVGVGGEPRGEEVRDSLLDGVRVERAGADLLVRVAFQGAALEPRASTLADPPRLVLDFTAPGSDTRERAGAVGPLRTIVIDAGHGGHDSGATGPGGLMEKDLVLDVARRVARLIEGELRVRVLFSRDGDHFVTLRDRTSFANRERADLFVSIHANAHREAANEGVETYFLSSEATDNAARQVAAAENSVVQLEKPASRARMDVVKAILWDLAQSEFQAESSKLAEVVQDSMTRALRIPNRGVKQAGFYVLGGAAMPAVLIEIGFVTNPREERRLKESRYRDDIARAILAGLAEYKRHWDQRVRVSAGPR
ncbi:MAG: N-acetylmuramoyl-L-alanine amidase [Candidatus Rokubacteria bacterium]|nr:N-acetylmuramoyl-L-alanine amidase [Candidatus Rokubacteria bacterium]